MQGWGGQSWNIFCGPVAVGGCKQKPMGSGLSYSANIAPWRWLAAETPLGALRGMEKYEDFRRP